MEDKLWREVKKYVGNREVKLGPYFTYNLLNSPRHLLFAFSRYKFAAKLIGDTPKMNILELGCNEGIGTLLLAENKHNVTGVDFDGDAIKWAKANLEKSGLVFRQDNFLGKTYGDFNAVVALDVIEHIEKQQEALFLQTITDNLVEDGFCIIGTPNVTADQYSTEVSKLGHVNMFSAERLGDTVRQYFRNAFVFSMNDEVVHTGFYPMSHYLIVLGCGKR